MSDSDRIVTVEGGHREMGRQLGEQLRDEIAETIELLRAEIPAAERDGVDGRVAAYAPFVERHTPHLADELRGLAEGARIRELDALFVQVRFELIGYEADGCTSFAVPRAGAVLTGQNVDTTPQYEPLGRVLRMRPDDGPDVLMYTYMPGMIGYLGINGAGLSCLGNAVVCPDWRAGFPRYLVVRRALEQETVAGAVAAIRGLERASSINLLLSDRAGVIRDVELTVDEVAVIEPGPAGLAHANHYVHDAFRACDLLRPILPDSEERLDRMGGLLGGIAGDDRLAAAKAALSDHTGYPTSICRHYDADGPPTYWHQTIASLIAEPAEGRLHVCFGNPCQREYVTFDL